ncbi:MAG TPA: glycosyltransferase family 4 protein, partial [Bacteroidota bacterium]|nr:glycosyltransferase family 4 protein [Bacteroidota bacterium]
ITKHSDFVALSKHIVRDLTERNIPPARIHLIPNSVAIRPNVHGGSRRGPVLFVGNVYGDVRQKGLDILLKAWPIVVSEAPRSRLAIVGVGDFAGFRDFVAGAKISSSVNFAGPQSDLENWYRSCRVFVLPSRYEGMSNALLEAMSYATPCVVTGISGSDDLIEDRIHGLKVPMEDHIALAHAIVFLLKHPGRARTLGARARRTVQKRHSPDTIARQYLSMFDAILRREQSAASGTRR